MSHKFFNSWTKGDRKNASEALRSAGIVPIPAECIAIRGMDYARTAKGSSKADRKPLPLNFDQSPGLTSKHSSRTNESIALQDAAVQSATNLLREMNDILRSPHVSAHLSAQQRSAGLAPMHGRPRSHTAPSTPLVEAPFVEPVELPGSLLAGKKSLRSLHQSIDGKGVQPPLYSPTSVSLGAGIPRPHSSPQEPTHSLGAYPRQVSESDMRDASSSLPSLTPSVASNVDHLQAFRRRDTTIQKQSSEDTLVGHDYESASIKRPSLSVLQPWPSSTSSLPVSLSTSQAGSSYAIPQYAALSQQAEAEATVMEHISSMRASHEAHLSMLKTAHERELDSYRSYISLLEMGRRVPSLAMRASKQSLTIDTSHGGPRASDSLHSDTSATTLQSFESSLESKKRASQESTAEVEALKRKLSLCRKAVGEANEVRRERDRLREAAERGDKKLSQLRDIVRKSKDHEKTLRNAVADLEARLIDANNERTDVLEGFREACDRLGKLTDRERALTQEVEDLRSRLFYMGGRHASDSTLALPDTNVLVRPKHNRTTSDLAGLAFTTGPPCQHCYDLRQLLRERDAKICELEQKMAEHTPPRAESAAKEQTLMEPSDQVKGLEIALAEHRRALAEAQADCERYNSLLHNELRRQSRHAAEKAYASTPNVEAVAVAEAARSLHSIMLSAGASVQEGSSESTTALLERELEHCLKEIVLYKLDIRGYKKDLKKAQAQIQNLQSVTIERPPTPDRESTASIRSTTSSERQQHISQQEAGLAENSKLSSGLGISLNQQDDRPTRMVASATAAALLSTTPPLRAAPTSPPSRPRTPLGTHKKLPKPPTSRTPSPLPAQTPASLRLQRGETLRSLSESIISSYANRSTPEQAFGLTPPTRERSSDPLRSTGVMPDARQVGVQVEVHQQQ